MSSRTRAAISLLAAISMLTACRQDQLLAESAKFEDLEKNLHATTAAVIAAPVASCARREALISEVQPFTSAEVLTALSGAADDHCVANRDLMNKVKLVLPVLDSYAIALVRAAKGSQIPDPKIGEAIASVNKADPKAKILPKAAPGDIDKVVTALETLLDRNLRANQISHVVSDVDPALNRITAGLVSIFGDVSQCDAPSGTWCSAFSSEADQLKKTWTYIADTSRRLPRGTAANRSAKFFEANRQLRQRFQVDLKAYNDAVKTGPAYADAIKAFQSEHTTVLRLIEARPADSTALLDR